MKKIKIKEGNRYPFPGFFIPIPVFVCNWGKSIKRSYAFTESCLYDLKDEDQLDCNKLFGFSIGHHHNCNSFRFAWRANLNNNKIEILYYAYINGERQKPIHLLDVDVHRMYTYKMSYLPKENIIKLHIFDTYYKNMQSDFTFPLKNNRKTGLGYKLGLYFGGNETAPQDIVIYKK